MYSWYHSVSTDYGLSGAVSRERSFAFSMPGLIYDLQLSSNYTEQILDTLEKIFTRFSCYHDLSQGKISKSFRTIGIVSSLVLSIETYSRPLFGTGKLIFKAEDALLFSIMPQWPFNFLDVPILKNWTYVKGTRLQFTAGMTEWYEWNICNF